MDVSQRFYVHAASFRPARVSRDWYADAVVPAIGRVYLRSLPLQIGLDVLWAIGATCGFLLIFDRFEPGSAHEGLACSAVTLALPRGTLGTSAGGRARRRAGHPGPTALPTGNCDKRRLFRPRGPTAR